MKKQAEATPAPEPRLLTVKQAAAYLSAHVWFIRKLVWDKKIPHVRFGHRALIDKADLDAFVNAQKMGVA